MPVRDTVVVGASAGGVEALRALVGQFPPDLPAAVLVVLHVPPHGGSVLPAILARSGPLPAQHAEHETPLEPGRIYVAPPDHHLVVCDGSVHLSRGPRENGHRPAADVLFRTAARSRGPRVIGVVLSGTLDDGAAGLLEVHRRGGVTIVQDPAEATYDAMPRSALEIVPIDYVLPAATIGEVISERVGEGVDDVPHASDRDEVESRIADLDPDVLHRAERPGNPAGYTCPECGGSLFEITEGDLVRFRCRVGHAWSSESLLVEQAVAVEGALWLAMRTLEDRAALAERLVAPARSRGHRHSAEQYQRSAREARQAAETIRRLIVTRKGSVADGAIEGDARRGGHS